MIGYYVHHQGDGHRQRALSIATHAPGRFVLLGSGLVGRSGSHESVDLCDDRPTARGDCQTPMAADCLHYVPEHHTGIQRRIATLATWIAEMQPALMVIDVSVEIAMLARLASIPTVYVRLSGLRADAAHLQAFRGARLLLAPFHEELDEPTVPAWVREKTCYVPGLTRSHTGAVSDANRILVVNGRGGGILDGNAIADAATFTPEFRWRVIGPATVPSRCPCNLELLGWVENADREIATAGVVVGTAGDGVVSAVLAAGRPFVCVPQRRPYDEQYSKARRLEALGAAFVLRRLPRADRWRNILEYARALQPATLSRLHDSDGASKAATVLQKMAER